jgi:hypothetical protein
MQPSGRYKRIPCGDHPVRAQKLLYDQACKNMRAVKQNRRTRFETHVPRPKR